MDNQNNKLPNSGDDYFSIEPIGSNKEEQVSWQMLQALYNHITGKSETLIDKHELPIMNSLIQLNNKIQQVCEQYTIRAINCSVTVFHQEET